ncbi:SIR2 family protein [Rhodobacter maris]|uniref:SIR2-like protein n=1 Tax=Rhodobacter maris TaxID=446682 RepID=A0A285TGK8_9RHOB|nr:SIR2 family protein [Rhodobacter maris]SOC21364.1 SIR2-like protein [Rhodobacter maris]
MSDEFPTSFDPSRCVLFLGAGFSAGAKNRSTRKNFQSPPVGSALNDAMKEMSGLPKDDPSDFADTAGYVISEGYDLFSLLEELYTIRELSEEQKEVLKLPWWRIYTTNYDNSVAVYRAASGEKQGALIHDITDPVPRQIRPGATIHLHGSIAKCEPDNVDKSLVLSRASYIEQRVKKSEWWDWYERDIKTCQFVFFLGYDINDFEPASYLARHPDLKSKCHFILRAPKSPVAISKVSNFGYRHSFQMEGFVKRLSGAIVAKRPEHENELVTFQYVDPAKDNKLPEKATSAEIQELFSFGRFRFHAAKASLPESDYILFRKNSTNSALGLLQESNTLIVHARIGNGKTIFVESLKVILSEKSYQCFTLKPGMSPLPQDILFISGVENPIIFFPSYDSAVANFHLFEGMPDDARYIVEMPTSILQVRMQEVQSRLRGKTSRLRVDTLDKDDVTNLKELLKKGGMTRLARSPILKPGVELRDFILASYEDPEIAARLQKAVGPLFESAAAKRVIVTAAILKAAGLPTEPVFIEDATGDDPYATLHSLSEGVSEVLEYGLEKIEPHSSIFSEYILKKYIDKTEFAGAVLRIASEAARRIDDATDETSERFRLARNIMSSTLRFSFLESVVGRTPEGRKIIKRLYEGCRRDVTIQKEPLFWLQYSIFWQDAPRWDLAESHIKEAYDRAEAKPSFKTYQLDTNYLGLLFDLEFHGKVGEKISRFDEILDIIDVCRAMIDDGSHRGHVAKSFNKVERMVSKRAEDFSRAQAAALTYALNLVVNKFSSLTPEERAVWGTDSTRESLERAVSKLKNLSFTGR